MQQSALLERGGADRRQLEFCAHAHGRDGGGVSVQTKCHLPFKGTQKWQSISPPTQTLIEMDTMIAEESNSLTPPASKEVLRASRRLQEGTAHPQQVYICANEPYHWSWLASA